MEPQPHLTDALHRRLQGPAQGGDLAGHQIGLLGAHPLRAGPGQPQQEGRDTGAGNELFQDLTHRHLAVQHLIVRPDDLDVQIPHRHKVPHGPLLARLHGGGPLPGDLPAPLLGIGSLSLSGAADDREAHVAHSLPVHPRGLVDLQQDVGEEGHGPQQGHPVGVLCLRLKRGEQQQLLPGQGLTGSARAPGTQLKVQGRVPLPDLHLLRSGAQQSGDLPALAVQHQFAHPPPAGEHGVQIAVQKGLDAPLSPPGGDSTEEPLQPRLGGGLPALHRHSAGQPDQLPDGRVQDGHRLPDGPVELELPRPQGHIPVQHAEGMPSALPDLHRLRPSRPLVSFPPLHRKSLLCLFRPLPVKISSVPRSRPSCRRAPLPPP